MLPDLFVTCTSSSPSYVIALLLLWLELKATVRYADTPPRTDHTHITRQLIHRFAPIGRKGCTAHMHPVAIDLSQQRASLLRDHIFSMQAVKLAVLRKLGYGIQNLSMQSVMHTVALGLQHTACLSYSVMV